MAVIVTAEQPALCFRNLEDRAARGDAQIGAFDEHEAAAHRKTVNRGNDRLFESPGHERVLDWRPLSAGRAALQ